MGGCQARNRHPERRTGNIVDTQLVAQVDTLGVTAVLTTDPDFHNAKLITARYYMTRQLPATALHLARIESGADPVMALPEAAF